MSLSNTLNSSSLDKFQRLTLLQNGSVSTEELVEFIRVNMDRLSSLTTVKFRLLSVEVMSQKCDQELLMNWFVRETDEEPFRVCEWEFLGAVLDPTLDNTLLKQGLAYIAELTINDKDKFEYLINLLMKLLKHKNYQIRQISLGRLSDLIVSSARSSKLNEVVHKYKQTLQDSLIRLSVDYNKSVVDELMNLCGQLSSAFADICLPVVLALREHCKFLETCELLGKKYAKVHKDQLKDELSYSNVLWRVGMKHCVRDNAKDVVDFVNSHLIPNFSHDLKLSGVRIFTSLLEFGGDLVAGYVGELIRHVVLIPDLSFTNDLEPILHLISKSFKLPLIIDALEPLLSSDFSSETKSLVLKCLKEIIDAKGDINDQEELSACLHLCASDLFYLGNDSLIVVEYVNFAPLIVSQSLKLSFAIDEKWRQKMFKTLVNLLYYKHLSYFEFQIEGFAGVLFQMFETDFLPMVENFQIISKYLPFIYEYLLACPQELWNNELLWHKVILPMSNASNDQTWLVDVRLTIMEILWLKRDLFFKLVQKDSFVADYFRFIFISNAQWHHETTKLRFQAFRLTCNLFETVAVSPELIADLMKDAENPRGFFKILLFALDDELPQTANYSLFIFNWLNSRRLINDHLHMAALLDALDSTLDSGMECVRRECLKFISTLCPKKLALNRTLMEKCALHLDSPELELRQASKKIVSDQKHRSDNCENITKIEE